jgi:hypothetical protein
METVGLLGFFYRQYLLYTILVYFLFNLSTLPVIAVASSKLRGQSPRVASVSLLFDQFVTCFLYS